LDVHDHYLQVLSCSKLPKPAHVLAVVDVAVVLHTRIKIAKVLLHGCER
jgi:hypothetical protein